MAAFRLSEFAGLAGLEVVRDAAFELTGKLSTPGEGLCVPLRSADYVDALNAHPQVAAVITSPEIADAVDARFGLALAEDPAAAHYEIHVRCAARREEELRARPNRISASAQIDQDASIATYGVEIGDRCRIGPNAVVGAGVVIGEETIIHSGVAIGVPGFNTGLIDGRRRIVPQVGGVRIGAYVELLANCCVARASFSGDTVIGEETVADNLVYIAHDVAIGRRVQLCALANILGRAVIEDNVYVGPSAVVSNGIRVGEGAKLSLGSVVTQDVEPGSTVTGNFAIGHDRFLSHLRSIR